MIKPLMHQRNFIDFDIDHIIISIQVHAFVILKDQNVDFVWNNAKFFFTAERSERTQCTKLLQTPVDGRTQTHRVSGVKFYVHSVHRTGQCVLINVFGVWYVSGTH